MTNEDANIIDYMGSYRAASKKHQSKDFEEFELI